MAGSKLGASPGRVVCRAGGARLQLWRAPGSPRSDHHHWKAHRKALSSLRREQGLDFVTSRGEPHLCHF